MEIQEIRTFGRRHGKKISKRQQWLVDNILPALSPKNIKNTGKIILEIGFGAGEHIRELALQNPDKIILGAEPFINGVASLLSSVTVESDNQIKTEFKNIFIYPDDVRKIIKKDSSEFVPILFSEIYILHPDPWPKARHEKRRLLNSDFLNLLSERLEKDGRIIIGTDHWEYYEWIIEQLKKTRLKIATTDLSIIDTRYKQKNKAKTTNPKYLVLSI
ncbi:MAG TPA: tRNA (guanine(46)-N(7))-methyltransferase TrmB [Alphaproteobacteria bacterium]|nr:tRNA (guanine(46)-N(7))-methyltransferase TrmB [Alphaproteobacteria bacterium]